MKNHAIMEVRKLEMSWVPFIGQLGKSRGWETSSHRRWWRFNGAVGFME
jgi:hypothetical protein